MNQRGKYIIIEGVDGVGKSTIAAVLKEQREAQGHKVQTVNILKDDPVSAKIRAILTDPENTIHPDAEIALYAAAVTNVYRYNVLPLLEQGIDVICDRSHLSTWAYQIQPQLEAGNERPLNIFDAAYDNVNPDALILLYADPKIGLTRCVQRDGQLDRLERRGTEYQEQVQTAYRNYGMLIKGGVITGVSLYEFENNGDINELLGFAMDLVKKI